MSMFALTSQPTGRAYAVCNDKRGKTVLTQEQAESPDMRTQQITIKTQLHQAIRNFNSVSNLWAQTQRREEVPQSI